jgi:hypothetical protein
MSKTSRNSRLNDDTTRIVASIHGVSEDHVRRVRRGDRNNEEILATAIEYQQGKSALIEHLTKLIPITPNPRKHGRKKN